LFNKKGQPFCGCPGVLLSIFLKLHYAMGSGCYA